MTNVIQIKGFPLGPCRIATNEGVFLRIVTHNPTPHSSFLRFRSGNPPFPKGEGFKNAFVSFGHYDFNFVGE